MKTKTMLKVGIILIIPTILSLLLNMVVSFSYWKDYGVDNMKNLNHEFVFWGCMVGFLCVSFLLSTMINMFKYVDDIDKLETAKEEYDVAKKEMETARDRFAELLSKK